MPYITLDGDWWDKDKHHAEKEKAEADRDWLNPHAESIRQELGITGIKLLSRLQGYSTENKPRIYVCKVGRTKGNIGLLAVLKVDTSSGQTDVERGNGRWICGRIDTVAPNQITFLRCQGWPETPHEGESTPGLVLYEHALSGTVPPATGMVSLHELVVDGKGRDIMNHLPSALDALLTEWKLIFGAPGSPYGGWALPEEPTSPHKWIADGIDVARSVYNQQDYAPNWMIRHGLRDIDSLRESAMRARRQLAGAIHRDFHARNLVYRFTQHGAQTRPVYHDLKAFDYEDLLDGEGDRRGPVLWDIVKLQVELLVHHLASSMPGEPSLPELDDIGRRLRDAFFADNLGKADDAAIWTCQKLCTDTKDRLLDYYRGRDDLFREDYYATLLQYCLYRGKYERGTGPDGLRDRRLFISYVLANHAARALESSTGEGVRGYLAGLSDDSPALWRQIQMVLKETGLRDGGEGVAAVVEKHGSLEVIQRLANWFEDHPALRPDPGWRPFLQNLVVLAVLTREWLPKAERMAQEGKAITGTRTTSELDAGLLVAAVFDAALHIVVDDTGKARAANAVRLGGERPAGLPVADRVEEIADWLKSEVQQSPVWLGGTPDEELVLSHLQNQRKRKNPLFLRLPMLDSDRALADALLSRYKGLLSVVLNDEDNGTTVVDDYLGLLGNLVDILQRIPRA